MVVIRPQVAQAETTEIDAEADQFQQEVERTAAAYDEATARIAELEERIANNEKELAKLEADLPKQQERGAEAIRALYLLQQDMPNLIGLILSAQSFNDILVSIDYLDRVQQSNLSAINSLQTLKDNLDEIKTDLTEARDAAYDEQNKAEQALADAQAARQEAQHKAQEEARTQAEAAVKEAEVQAIQAAPAQEEEQADEPQPAPESTPVVTEPIEVPSEDNADWSSDKVTFVDEWSGRIDAYLAGSPLAGQGDTFAEAAWNYGVDPRWSPAISNTESTKGAYCTLTHNAWGWGSESWDSWEEAIDAHVRGLSHGYGYTISVDAAKKYCPSNWEHWYNATTTQMDMI